MLETIFTLAYCVGLLAGSIIRVIYTRQYRQTRIASERETSVDRLLMFLPFLGMIVLPVVYALTAWLDFANYDLPAWAGWLGVALFALALWLLWRTHVDLGRNWSPTMEIVDKHSLVTRGVYRHMRHPMYTAHLLWGIAQPLLLHNWIAGFGMLAAQVPLYLYRIPREEKMMLQEFGEEYREYMQRTGRLIPHF